MVDKTLTWGRSPATGKLDSIFVESEYYIINGAGFGTKTTTPYYDDFETRVAGATGSSVGSLQVSNSSGATISTVAPRSGTKCLQNDYSLQRFPKIYHALSQRSNRVKFSCWFRFDGTVTGGSNVWKFLRFSNTEGNDPYNGQNSFSHEFTSTIGVANPVSTSTSIELDGGLSSWSIHTTSDVTPDAAFVNGQWLFYQAEIYTGTEGNADANIVMRVNGKRIASFYNRQYLSATHPLGVSLVLTPLDGFDDYTSTTVVMKMDSLSVDGSAAECIMTDNAVYASSTNWEPQPINYLTDAKAYIKRKRGTFTSGATAYYHIWDTSGNYVSSYAGLVV